LLQAFFPARMMAGLLVLAVAASLLYRVFCPGWVLYRQAEEALAAGKKAEALELVRAMGGEGRDRGRLRLRAAELALRAGDAALAGKWMEWAWADIPHPGLDEVRLAAGIADALRQPSAALDFYLDFQRGGGELDAAARLHLADLYRERKAYPEAEALYRQLGSENRDVAAAARLHWAEMLSWQQNYAEAAALFREILAARPGDREARLGLARTLEWMGAHDEAVAEYRKLTGGG
jgi:tetratricopeptide (TPR) repeat protein